MIYDQWDAQRASHPVSVCVSVFSCVCVCLCRDVVWPEIRVLLWKHWRETGCVGAPLFLCLYPPTRSLWANDQRGRKLTVLSFLPLLSSIICFPLLFDGIQQTSNTYTQQRCSHSFAEQRTEGLFKGYMTIQKGLVICWKWRWVTHVWLLWRHIPCLPWLSELWFFTFVF